MVGSDIASCRPDCANTPNIISSCSADSPSLLFIPALLQGQCVSPLSFFFFFQMYPCCVSSKQTTATVEAVVYHISNESRVIVCIPETAMIHCLALARDQPLNNVYHCLPGLFNYLQTLLTNQQGSLCFKASGLVFTNMCNRVS